MEWWEKVPKSEEELIGLTEYVEKKLELAEKNGGVKKEDMLEHFEEEEVEKFEANFPWKDISFDEYLLLMGYDIDFYHQAGKRLLNGEDIKKGNIKKWYKVVKEYNTKTINQYQNISARAMFKWLARNKSFDKYSSKYKNHLDKNPDDKFADVTAYNQMLSDYMVEAIVPPFADETAEGVFFEPSKMKVTKIDRIPKIN